MIAFIDDHRGAVRGRADLQVLPIAPSTYHAHVARRRDPDRAPPRVRRDARLRGQIRWVFEDNFGVYAVRKVWRQLKREGEDVVVHHRAIDAGDGLARGVVRGKPAKMTLSDRSAACPLDKVNR